ncbi:MAG: hypothetical protein RLZZ241_1048 [Bacteroidota bacterium]|jgi:gamma-glutamyltranspeptidase/glutathione hydrolase
MKIRLITLLVLSCIGIPLASAQKKYANNVVAAAHPLAVQAGATMFEKGGNAYDAAVASAFALAVVEPSMSGIGGRLQAIYRTALGETHGIDASTAVPMHYIHNDQKYSEGYRTIGIPGVVAGLEKLHSKKGILPWKTLLEPAITYARYGFKLLPGEAARHNAASKSIAKYPGTAASFLGADQKTLSAGAILVQEDLAQTLEIIARKGAIGFYKGAVAHRIARDMKKNGSILNFKDLKNYEALDLQVLEGVFKGHTIKSLYLPSYGAITTQILQIADHFDTPKNNTDWTNQLGYASEIGYAYRAYQDIPDSLNAILSMQRAAQWAKAFNSKIAVANSKTSSGEYTASQGHTTHLTTADAWGNVVSLTQTLGPNMGSKVVTPGLGFLYAVTLGGYLGEYKPGDRAQSHISPTLVEKEGQLVLALGAAGGNKIVIAVAQVISRYIDQRFPLDQALALPRVYPNGSNWQVENHDNIFTNSTSATGLLREVEWVNLPAYFGRVHAVGLDLTANRWFGSADPDWEGTTLSVE